MGRVCWLPYLGYLVNKMNSMNYLFYSRDALGFIFALEIYPRYQALYHRCEAFYLL